MIEAKVKAATVAVYLLCTGGLAIVNAVQGDTSLLGFLPVWAEPFVVGILPALASFIAGYQAKHTPRPDLGPVANRYVPTE